MQAPSASPAETAIFPSPAQTQTHAPTSSPGPPHPPTSHPAAPSPAPEPSENPDPKHRALPPENATLAPPYRPAGRAAYSRTDYPRAGPTRKNRKPPIPSAQTPTRACNPPPSPPNYSP